MGKSCFVIMPIGDLGLKSGEIIKANNLKAKYTDLNEAPCGKPQGI